MSFTYNDKLNIISEFFGVSYPCAKYMYHRRRKGYPYKKPEDDGYLKWDVQIQNGLVSGDLFNIEYKNLHFDNDINELHKEYGVDINLLPNEKIQKNKILQTDNKKSKISNGEISEHADDTDGEWNVITTKKTLHDKKKILRQMGFYISSYNLRNSKTNEIKNE